MQLTVIDQIPVSQNADITVELTGKSRAQPARRGQQARHPGLGHEAGARRGARHRVRLPRRLAGRQEGHLRAGVVRAGSNPGEWPIANGIGECNHSPLPDSPFALALPGRRCYERARIAERARDHEPLSQHQRWRSARWSSRFALFSVGLLLVTLVLHRFIALPTPLALNLFLVGLGGAGLAVLIGLAALARIWFTGHAGAGSAAVGLLLAAAGARRPAGLRVGPLRPAADQRRDHGHGQLRPPSRRWPSGPPGANATAYPGQPFADLQAKAYPDLRTLVLDRSVEEAFELVEEAVRRLRWRVVAEEPPTGGRTPRPASSRPPSRRCSSGFTDDIVIRIEGGRDARRASMPAPPRATAASISARTRRGCAGSSPRFAPARSVTPSAAVAASKSGPKRGAGRRRSPAQAAESARSAESGESQRTRPREIRCSTCASTERRRRVYELGVQVAVDRRHDRLARCWCRRGCSRGSPARACAGAAGRP